MTLPSSATRTSRVFGHEHHDFEVLVLPAEASSYLTVIEREDIPRVVATARVVDTLVKRHGTWLVTRHQVSVDPGMFKAFADAQGAQA